VDGNRCPKWSYPSEAIVKGDSLYPQIAAASIIAKVARDKDMLNLHNQHPEYGFDKHKGYPTAQHMAALVQYGALSSHRRSFKPVQNVLMAAQSQNTSNNK
jgi:ribonuclease HII